MGKNVNLQPTSYFLLARNVEVLEKLFGSGARVRMLRLLLQNPEAHFTFQEITNKTKVHPRIAKIELQRLEKINLVQQRLVTLKEHVAVGKKKVSKIKTKKAYVYSINPRFSLLQELHDLVVKDSLASHKKLLQQIKGLGSIKLAILSGIFINNDKSRTDLLVVGDKIKKSRLRNFLENIESEMGRSPRYTVMDTKEFEYRMDMYDRFLRDILEFPHQKLINRVKL